LIENHLKTPSPNEPFNWEASNQIVIRIFF
jgi:hypothetical protein